MLSTLLKTVECLWRVRDGKISPSSFVARQGGQASDMFRITWDHGDDQPLSLQDYHFAFLASPLFRMELYILSTLQQSHSARTTTKVSHLHAVAAGQMPSVGPWTTRWTDGDCRSAFSKDTPPHGPASVTRIMQATIHGKPFCDTWWSIEKLADGQIELVFGTDIKRYTNHWCQSIVVLLLGPFHNLYSRLLLASATANLLEKAQAKV